MRDKVTRARCDMYANFRHTHTLQYRTQIADRNENSTECSILVFQRRSKGLEQHLHRALVIIHLRAPELVQ